jgi:hypothetical protein
VREKVGLQTYLKQDQAVHHRPGVQPTLWLKKVIFTTILKNQRGQKHMRHHTQESEIRAVQNNPEFSQLFSKKRPVSC